MTAPGADARLADWLAYQEQLHPSAIELGLGRVREVAGRLGLPASGIVTLTVAGTNGKGSSATLASQIYRQAGYRTGLYTSPHLLHYNERVSIDGDAVSDAALCQAFAAIEAARGDVLLTYFEFGTLAALWLFRRAGVQVQVLEVGLGGRLDAVNLVDADCAIVTNIGLDHLDWLGHDRESIGAEKAGVFRASSPAICVDPDPPASVATAAQRLGAPLLQLGREFGFAAGDGVWSWRGVAQALDALPAPGLAGAVQLRNAAGVLAAVEALQARAPVSPDAIRAALPRLRLRGRFERRGRWLFDVAHNAEAADVLADNIASLGNGRRIWLVIGMLSDKPVEKIVARLRPLVAGITFVSLPPPRGLSARQLRDRSAAPGGLAESLPAALAAAQGQAGADDDILVCGSFLTVTLAMEALGADVAA